MCSWHGRGRGLRAVLCFHPQAWGLPASYARLGESCPTFKPEQWTGGINAIGNIDQPTLPFWITGPWAGNAVIEVVPKFSFAYDPVAYYVLIVILVIIAVILVTNLHRSRLGRAWMAIREDEVAAKAMGINPDQALASRRSSCSGSPCY